MSDDIDAVIELLERWRDATGMGRMRIGIDATRTIAALPAARKRALAIEVAERVAPQLVPAIQAEDGDLTTQQVGAVVDLLRRADQEQLDDLVAALRSGDVIGTIDLVDDAVAVVAPPDAGTDALLEDLAPADDEQGAAGAGGAGVTAAAAAAASALGDDEVEVAADGSVRLDEEAVRERMQAEAAQHADRYRDTSRDVPATPAYRAPDLDFITEDLELPDPTIESVAPLHERMARPSDARGPGRLATAPVTQVVAAVTATPDGYRRRRAALQAIRDGRLRAEDVLPIVRSLERGTDRTWVAGAALDADLIDGSDLDHLDLSTAAVGRLRRRAR